MIFKVLYDVILWILDSIYTTSSLFVKEIATLYNHLNKFSKSADIKLATMSKKMILKYDNIGGYLDSEQISFIEATLDLCSKLENFWSFGLLIFLLLSQCLSLLHE